MGILINFSFVIAKQHRLAVVAPGGVNNTHTMLHAGM